MKKYLVALLLLVSASAFAGPCHRYHGCDYYRHGHYAHYGYGYTNFYYVPGPNVRYYYEGPRYYRAYYPRVYYRPYRDYDAYYYYGRYHYRPRPEF